MDLSEEVGLPPVVILQNGEKWLGCTSVDEIEGGGSAEVVLVLVYFTIILILVRMKDVH